MIRTLTITILTVIPVTMAGLFAHAENDEVLFDKAVYQQGDQTDADLQAVEDEAQVELVQWGGGGGGGGSQMWTCRARTRDGRTFIGQSRSINTARRQAMSRCGSRSRSCFMSSCR